MNSIIDYFTNPLNIIVIILLSIVLISTLGTYKEGFGSTDKVITIDGVEINDAIFIGKNGNTAKILSKNGTYIIMVIYNTGNRQFYKLSSNDNSNDNSTEFNALNSYSLVNNTVVESKIKKITFYGPNGKAVIIKLNGNVIIQITLKNGDVETYAQNNVYDQPSFFPNQASYSSSYYDNLPNYSKMFNQSYNDTFNKNVNSNISNYDYSSSLPPAIPASQIPPGQEDLYILKSEIVPPVCPAPITACHHKTDKCAPCPPCGRCPEPNFECKKVPSYKPNNPELPQPYISPFSTYGS